MTIPVAFAALGSKTLTKHVTIEGYCSFLNADPRFTAQICTGPHSALAKLSDVGAGRKWLVVLTDLPARLPVQTVAEAAKLMKVDTNILVMADADDGSSPLTPLPVTKEMLEAREPITIVAPDGMVRRSLSELLALVA